MNKLRVCNSAKEQKKLSSNINLLAEFRSLVDWLSQCGFDISIINYDKGPPLIFAKLTNTKGVTGGFAVGNPEICHSFVFERIALDNDKCFDKWSKCPLVMKLDGLDKKALVAHMLWLGSVDGFEYSTKFTYFYDPVLPLEIPDLIKCKQ